jgi:hypothetical protein
MIINVLEIHQGGGNVGQLQVFLPDRVSNLPLTLVPLFHKHLASFASQRMYHQRVDPVVNQRQSDSWAQRY